MSEKTQKKSWFKGLSSEFKKIVWHEDARKAHADDIKQQHADDMKSNVF